LTKGWVKDGKIESAGVTHGVYSDAFPQQNQVEIFLVGLLLQDIYGKVPSSSHHVLFSCQFANEVFTNVESFTMINDFVNPLKK
jgi:hypothetical protein